MSHDEVLVEPLLPTDAAEAATMLLAAERAIDGELVDEAERRRLLRYAEGDRDRAPGWRPLAARRGSELVGYGGLVLPDRSGGGAVGDAAPLPDAAPRNEVLTALFAALEALAQEGDAGTLEVWLRRADAADLALAARHGLPPGRRVAVLGRDLPVDAASPAAPQDVTIRAYLPERDDEQVVDVLQGAYAGTDDGGWELGAFRERRGWDWFRAEDLLVAEAGDGLLLGLHWLKRRGETVGEVHNLAIHPRGQGRGLGAALLRAGLDHLTAVGCREVVLWVDRANDRAVRLYERQGFTTRWEDVALRRTLGGGTDRS
ncbi:MAG: GNAT family N-acetyltransferase [Nitriliruptor sp.]